MNSIFSKVRMPLVIASVLLVVAAACGEASGSADDASAEATSLSAIESSSPEDVVTPEGSPEDVVTPEGTVSVVVGSENQAPSYNPDASSNGEEAVEVEWLEYEDPDLGFQISYPATLVPSSVDPADFGASALAVIEFRDPALLEQEPPIMTIWVRQNSQTSQEAWIDELTATGGPWQSQDTTVGGVDAVLICSPTYRAPGCHVFVQEGGLAYTLVPLGDAADQMLATCEFVG